MSELTLPDFKMVMPSLSISSLHLKNYKRFVDYRVDFNDKFICFVGPNGYGKTSILDAISNVFCSYEKYDEIRLRNLLGKSIRHSDRNIDINDEKNDFSITCGVKSSVKDYEVTLGKQGFSENHPKEIQEIISRICFYAKFDQELQNFQLPRNKWKIFKELFEAVTGFTIEERDDMGSVLSLSGEDRQKDITSKYVLSFWVNKKDETINYKECSAGERKIIKCFSTLLTKEYEPQIILVDNVTMHVEEGRHIKLLQSIKKCFKDSQIFTTAHSYQVSRNFTNKSEIHDLRLIHGEEIFKQEPWRLYLTDELNDMVNNPFVINKGDLLNNGLNIISDCKKKNYDKNNLIKRSEIFIKDAIMLRLNDL